MGRVKPWMLPMLVRAWLAPFGAGRPLDASDPDTGRSLAIQISPFDPPVVVELPHAKATTVARMRTVSPLARTIWFPLVFLGGEFLLDASITRRPLPNPKGRGESAPATSAASLGVAELLLRVELSTRGAPQVKSSGNGPQYGRAPV